MVISAIVACAHNGVIGQDNQIPWYLPADLSYFKRITLNHHIIMGRNSFESIGRPLPKRTNVVISRNPYFIATGCVRAFSIKEALKIAQDNGETEAFIIGGGEIYKQSMALWDKLYITNVDVMIEGSVVFPMIDYDHWTLINEEKHLKDDKNPYDYTFKVFEKVKSTHS